MSLYGVLRSGVSGMNAQSNKLGTVAENIQNSSTTGYKRASTEFSSLLLPSNEGSYNSGSVLSNVRHNIADQGPITYTTSHSDLAVSGNGFFVVSDLKGSPYLTRAGNFVIDGRNGDLVNAAGFTLMGYSLASGPADPALNSFDNIVPINLSSLGMRASASTQGTFTGNLPFGAQPIVSVGTPTPAVLGQAGFVDQPVAGFTAGDQLRFRVGGGTEQTFAITTQTSVDDLVSAINTASAGGTLSGVQASKGSSPDTLVLTSTDITGNTNVTSSFADLDGGGGFTPGADTAGIPVVRGQVSLPVANLTTGDEIRFSVGGGDEQIFKVTAETSVDALIDSLNAAVAAGRLTGIVASKDPVTGQVALISSDETGGTDVAGSFTDIMPISKQSSLQVFDNVGNPVKLDLALTKTGVNTWSIAVSHDATLLAGPHTLTFDANGQVTGASSITFPLLDGGPFTLDMAGMTQLAGDYTVTGSANGNPPSNVKDAEFSADGTVYAVYEDGTRVGVYALALATVPSPDNLAVRAGNVYEATGASGSYQVGLAQTSGFGSVLSGALEGSNVDIGAELTAMIEAQTSYTANSKVFQTGSELLDVLMNLSR